ncbi:MAG: PD-(D/E)XK nuclease family protein [Actinobacteria bacterium]|nr:PD-(D/E)XK nuclease family protein [Actinomycetota bacterium]
MAMAGRWVRHGRPAAEALAAAVRQGKATEPLAPVTVVVPSNQVAVAARRLLASGTLGPVSGAGPGLVAVDLLTPYRLAELLGSATLAGEGRRPVSTPVVTAAVRRALRDGAGVFAAVAEHPATEAALVSAYRELRDLSDGARRAVGAQSRRAADVVRLHDATRAALAPGWYDEQDLMATATRHVAAGAARHLGRVVVHLPERLSRHAALLLRAVADAGEVVVIAGTTGQAGADAEVASSLERLGLDLGPPPAGSLIGSVVAPGRTRIVTTSDADEEVRAAVRAVVDAVRAGTPLDRIAVLHGSREPYARLVHEHLRAAGVPANGTAEVPVAGRLAGRALLALIELPALGFRREAVFAWLTSVPVVVDGRPAPVASWERLSREAGVVGGVEQWDQLLESLAHRLDEQRASLEADPEQPEWRADKAHADAQRARALRQFVVDLAAGLGRAGARPQPWSMRARWASRLLERHLGGPGRRERWPAAERKAAERVEVALDRLAALDDVEGPVTLEVFARTLAVELENDLGRVGRSGEGVLVGPVELGVGLDLDLVVVLGLAEGTFPATVRDDSLLPDGERAAARGELALRADQVHRVERALLASLAAAPRQVLGVPRGDLRRSTGRVASRFVLDVAAVLSGAPRWNAELLRRRAPWLHHVASFDAGLREAPAPATAQEHRLRALLAAAPTRTGLTAVARSIDGVTARGAALLDARRSPALTRFDGNLAGLAIPSPVERGASASSLERWAACPFAYFVHDLLRAQPVEEPEDLLEISALERGSLVHRILERFLLEVLARPAAEQPAPHEAWTAADEARLLAIADEECHAVVARGVAGRPVFWHRERTRLAGELRRFLAEDSSHRRRTGTRPIAAELAFGLRDDPAGGAAGGAAVEMALADGRSISMRGKADRVDEGTDGLLHVLDYKTGSPTSYKDISATDPHLHGTKLQLAVYGQAARRHVGRPSARVRADYWFVSSKAGFVRKGYEVAPEVLGLVSAAMGTIVRGIEAGLFTPNPPDRGTSPRNECEYCDPDDLGNSELRRQIAAKLGDPHLAEYVALTQPIGPDGEDET